MYRYSTLHVRILYLTDIVPYIVSYLYITFIVPYMYLTCTLHVKPRRGIRGGAVAALWCTLVSPVSGWTPPVTFKT